ncbi:MAG: hypothetical protein PWP11_3273 [Thauera sp.]|nr:hypothetical protein [Thauera sp.]MDI3491996.1 hypothetical protein [Thauera sp.]
MSQEDNILAAWRTIDQLRFASEQEIRDMRVALCEIRDNLEIILS